MFKILIAEDDRELRQLFQHVLTKNGYSVVGVSNGEEALHALDTSYYDLIISDIMMPKMDGYQLVSALREAGMTTPVMMITAKDEDADRILGLDIGADDYIVKPFSPGEVMARIRAVLRRIPAAAEKEMLVIGELSIHLPSLSATLSGHKLNLTRREVELLYTLAASPGRVFTRDNLLTIVWGYEFAGNYRAVDSHIKRLRAKLDAYPHDTFTIATVWGAGYKFERNLP